MPVYCYICECGRTKELFRPFSEYDQPTGCECGRTMRKDIAKQASGQGYFDVPFDSVDYDLTGRPIPYKTRGELKRIAAKHGCDVDFGQRSREVKRGLPPVTGKSTGAHR